MKAAGKQASLHVFHCDAPDDHDVLTIRQGYFTIAVGDDAIQERGFLLEAVWMLRVMDDKRDCRLAD